MTRPDHGIRTIIISRTDSIGDVMLTLPMAGILKKHFPGCRVIFLGRNYTKAVIACCTHVDEFLNWDELSAAERTEGVKRIEALQADAILHVFPDKDIASLAKKAGIPLRIGTSHRAFHLLTCNKRVAFSRKNSNLHEAQLNLKLLPALGIEQELSCGEINTYTGFTRIPVLPETVSALIDPGKFNVILHPRSKGSAREWGLENFSTLIGLLPKEGFKLFISGTQEEGLSLQALIQAHPETVDLTGKLSLPEFIGFISRTQALVAASTGPLHIASALGKKAMGIYAPMHPIHPGRWAPIGTNAEFLVKQVNCSDCRKTNICHCIREITPQEVAKRLVEAAK